MVTLFPRHQPVTIPRRRRRALAARARLGLAVLLTGAATASVAAPPEELLAERRDAYVRDLSTCGRTKACLMRPHAAALHADLATPAPTVGKSRWSEHEYDRVTVWIAPGEATPHWRAADRYMVRDAFHAWTAAGAPVRFVFVPDSARADVRVLWRDSLPDGRAGQATRFVDRRGWLRAATIEMSLNAPAPRAPRPSMVRAVALHEVGHLLGLEHSAEEHDLMAPLVTARTITPHDRSVMRALYNVADP